MNQAEQITAASRSNLAFALFALPKERRRDMATFYAFCRIVDDIADAPEMAVSEKRRQLELWKRSIFAEHADDPPLAGEVRALIKKYAIDPQLFIELILGMEMDLEPRRFATFEELRQYCYRVASVVGLASIEIFGYKNSACKDYAVNLGYALQLTNIIRDVAQDAANGERIYLPLEDLRRFGYSESDLLARRHNAEFVTLMEFQAQRARDFFRRALEHLPAEDRRSMIAAESMRAIYFKLLGKIERGRFRVFDRRFRVNRAEKLLLVATAFLKNR